MNIYFLTFKKHSSIIINIINTEEMNTMPRINQSIETSVINDKGLMVDKRANRTLSWGEEPRYIKLYIQDILYLADMPPHHSAILYELLKKASYAGEKDGMQVIINASLKRRIAEALDIKNIGSISNAITDLRSCKKSSKYRIFIIKCPFY
jgi:hypothetical protein